MYKYSCLQETVQYIHVNNRNLSTNTRFSLQGHPACAHSPTTTGGRRLCGPTTTWDPHGVRKPCEDSTAAGICWDGPWPRPACCSPQLVCLCNAGAQRSAHSRRCRVLASGLVGWWPCKWPSCVPSWWNGRRDPQRWHQAWDCCPHHCRPTRRPRGRGQLPWHWNNKNNSKIQFIRFSMHCRESAIHMENKWTKKTKNNNWILLH